MAISGKTHTEAIYDIHPAEFLVDEINIQKFTVSLRETAGKDRKWQPLLRTIHNSYMLLMRLVLSSLVLGVK